ncbi:hypothetical protein BC940DRAFT_333259 [Gongronella butleri]|nr:hypothetical protein BC940DRAFT_333259 [Gongronella butleri]
MSSEKITVSLSRLALAKAIKTPDDTDEGEPWFNSIIFHQSHVTQDMIDAMVRGPQQQQHGRRHHRPQQQHQQQQQQQARQQRPSHHPQQQRQSQLLPPQRPSTSLEPRTRQTLPKDHPHRRSTPLQTFHNHRSSEMLGSSSRGKRIDDLPPRPSTASALRTMTKPRYASDDDEDDDEDEKDNESDNDSDSSEDMPLHHTLQASSPKPPATTPMHNPDTTMAMAAAKRASSSTTPSPASTPSLTPAVPKKKIVPVASDDESDEDDHESDESDDDDGTPEKPKEQPLADENDAHTKARRMSTLRQLERGPSVHKRSRSLGAMDKIYTADVALENGLVMNDAVSQASQEMENIAEWHQTVMAAMDNASENQETTKTTEKVDASGTMTTTTTTTTTPSTGSTLSSVGSTSSPSRPGSRTRRNTLGQMDMMYYAQQQQLQYLQQQQMAQIQQYHQVAWQQQQQQLFAAQQQAYMQAAAWQQQQQQFAPYQPQQLQQLQQLQQQPQPKASRSSNRLSAMDLLNQFEKEKTAKLPPRLQPKKIDPSKAHIDGLLGNVKDNGAYNISFQTQQRQIKERADRMARHGYYPQQSSSSAQYGGPMPIASTSMPRNLYASSSSHTMQSYPSQQQQLQQQYRRSQMPMSSSSNSSTSLTPPPQQHATMVRSESSPNHLSNMSSSSSPAYNMQRQSMYLEPTMAASTSNMRTMSPSPSKQPPRPASSMMLRTQSAIDL